MTTVISPALCFTVIAIGGSATPDPIPPLAAIWLRVLSKLQVPPKLGIGVFKFGFAAVVAVGVAGRAVVSRVTGVFGVSSRPKNKSRAFAFGFGTNFWVRPPKTSAAYMLPSASAEI